MNTSYFLSLSVPALAKEIQSQSLTSQELTRSLLGRAQALNPTLNAFISFRNEQALKEAEQADKEIKQGHYRGLYHGIPIALKDNIYLKGEVTTMGAKIHQDYVPKKDATVVKKLREAGAIIIGKLNLHEYAWGITTNNPHFGACHNPWDKSKIPGGSSGGSGAAIAAGLSFGSIGTDTAGSIRIPAACCGVVGLKPTYDLVSRDGVFPLSPSLDHVGPMGRSIEEVAILLDIIADKKPEVAYCDALNQEIKGLTLGVDEAYYFHRVDKPIAKATQKIFDSLEKQGVTFKNIEIPELSQAEFAGYMTIMAEAFTVHWDNLQTRLKDFGPDLQALYQAGMVPSSIDYLKAQTLREKIKAAFAKTFTEVDALISPTIPILPPDIGSDTAYINGEPVGLDKHIMRFMIPSNVAGLPSLVLPIEFSGGLSGRLNEGLPTSLQLIGPQWSEAMLLNLGKKIAALAQFTSLKPMIIN